jgi:hypothetical protein
VVTTRAPQVTSRTIMPIEQLTYAEIADIAQQSAQVVTPQTWSEMTWRQRIPWLRTTG